MVKWIVRTLTSGRGEKFKVARLRFAHLSLERPEDRLAPSGTEYDWTGNGGNNNASNAANWNVNGLPAVQAPGNGDILVVDGQSGANSNNNVTFDAAFMANPASVKIANSYTGSVAVNTNLIVGQFTQSGSTVTVNSNVSLAATIYNINGGYLIGDGDVYIEGLLNPGALNIQGPNPSDISVNYLSIGTSSALNIGAPVTFAGGAGTFVVNYGDSSTWTAGDISVRGGTTFINNGTLAIECDNTMSSFALADGDGVASFVNYGELIKETTTGTTHIATGFYNNGSWAGVDVQSGTLSLEGPGTDSAPFDVAANASLVFEGPSANVTLGNGTEFTGNGYTILDSGANVTVASLATINFATPLFLTDVAGGMSPTLDATRGQAFSQRSLWWQEGTIKGQFTANGYATLETAGQKTFAAGTFINNANLDFEDTGNLTIEGQFENYHTFDIQNDATIDDGGVMGSAFTNYGVVTKTDGVAGAGAFSTINIVFGNQGELDLNGYTIQFKQSVAQNGNNNAVTNLGGGTLWAAAGTFFLDNGLLSGGGTVSGNLQVGFAGIGTFIDATVEVGDTLNDPSLTITGNYSQFTAGALNVHAWGNTMFGMLTVDGTATLGGLLEVTAEPGWYVPTSGDNALVLEATMGVNGTFDVVAYPWDAIYQANSVGVLCGI